jgi:DNA-3-methyladenine glycosylase II
MPPMPLTAPPFWTDATAFLSAHDAVMKRLIREHAGFHLQRRNDAFTTLARAIIGQQISVKAADAVWRRFCDAMGNPITSRRKFPKADPAVIAALDVNDLRQAGLSQRKTEYIQDLARHFESGALNPKQWKNLDDEALITALTAVKGIGRWSAEMFLIFHEHRPDVFPIADLGLRRAIRTFYGEIEVDEMSALAERWCPYRSVATWYLWRALDAEPVEY